MPTFLRLPMCLFASVILINSADSRPEGTAELASSPFPVSALRDYAAKQRWSDLPTSKGAEEFPEWAGQTRFYAESQGQGGHTGYQEWIYTASNGKSSRFKMKVPADISPS